MRNESYPALNLPSVKLRADNRVGCVYVWDELRGKWLFLTPEEWVRRHVIGYLIDGLGVPATSIVQENPVMIEGMSQRADIVVVAPDGKAKLLVECKCPDVKIDASVLDQALRYNTVVGARFIMITNGLKHYFYATYNGTDYSQLDSFPDLGPF